VQDAVGGGRGMSDTAGLHLKLDRLLAGQDKALAATNDLEAAIRAQGAGLAALLDGLAANRELLAQIAAQMSEETGGQDLALMLVEMNRILAQLLVDSTHMVELLADLPDAMERAAMDGAAHAASMAAQPT